jgi:hypothetical protein
MSDIDTHIDTHIEHWLHENSRYKENETFRRYKSGLSMPGGMKRELEKAQAYASGALGVDDKAMVDSLDHLDGPRKREMLTPFLEGKDDRESKRPDLLGNSYAEKVGEDKKESTLYIRVRTDQKAAYVNAANGGNLSAWVTEVLDKEVEKTRIIKSY